MRLHAGSKAKRFSAEYGKTWTKEIVARTRQDIQLYGWYHNYPYHNLNDLTWWGDRKRPRITLSSFALREPSCSIFSSLLRYHESSIIHKLSIGGAKTLLLPVDKSFQDKDFVDSLVRDPRLSSEFVLRHVVPMKLDVRGLGNRCQTSKSGVINVNTMAGKSLSVRMEGSLETGSREVFFGNGRVSHHGLKCSNGVVFILETTI
jgi:hypothetical protein